MHRTVTLPKNLTINFLSTIVNNLNITFKLKGLEKEGFVLNLSEIKKVDLVGILILFKFIEYSVIRKSFKNPEIIGHEDGEISKAIESYGFKKLLQNYIRKKNVEKVLENLEIGETNSVLIAPQALLRGNINSKNEFDRKINMALEKFYGKGSYSIRETILSCAVEISSNFYNHAVKDTRSIILARGTKNYFEIACADTASGIPSSFKSVDKFSLLSNQQLLENALKKEVTSKPSSDHMGYGLWIVSEVIKKYKGTLLIISEDSKIQMRNGLKETSAFPFWQGSLIYLKIPIKPGLSIADILRKKRSDIGAPLKINFA